MKVEKYPLTPPPLEDLASKLRGPLSANFTHSTVSVEPCPDLRAAPFHLATEGLSGDEKIADIGGQPNLFPVPLLTPDKRWTMHPTIALEAMEMDPHKGSLIGAGAGPYHVIGQNSELAPNLSWGGEGGGALDNKTCFAGIERRGDGSGDENKPILRKSPCADCALMMNLYGSRGDGGPVLKVTARGRKKGMEKSLTECMRKALDAAYGGSGTTISLGGAFVIKSGKATYHIMPDFPDEKELPFRDRHQLNAWLRYHDFGAPMVCLSVLHSGDPGNRMGGLRLEHTHCFRPGAAEGEGEEGAAAGGHYHGDAGGKEDGDDEIEYEGYFNTAKVVYRVERPEAVLEKDLHDD